MATLQMNFLSMKLGMQTNVTVYLPGFVPSPDDAGKTDDQLYPRDERFPTLWLLGTERGDDGEWLRETGILRLAEKLRMAVVFPCVYEKFYSEDPKGQKFTGAIAEELYSVCTGMFPLSRAREDNMIGGASLGAYGALKCALSRPDRFGSVIMLGGAYEKDIRNGYFAALNREAERCGLPPCCALDDAPPEDAELSAAPGAPLPVVWLGWADGAPLASYASRAAQNLSADGFPLVAQLAYQGPDDWDFREKALADALNAFAKRKEEA